MICFNLGTGKRPQPGAWPETLEVGGRARRGACTALSISGATKNLR